MKRKNKIRLKRFDPYNSAKASRVKKSARSLS